MPAPRPRVTRFGTHNPKPYVKWKQETSFCLRVGIKAQGVTWDQTGTYELSAHFICKMVGDPLKRSVRPRKVKRTKPDLSNFIKALEDAAEGVLWENDSRIAAYGSVAKYEAGQDEEPHIVVRVRRMDA